MKQDGTSAFPSEQTLAMNTGLSLRSVKTHLARAAKTGWIERRYQRYPGKALWHYRYLPRFPVPVKIGAAPAPTEFDQAGAFVAQDGASYSQGGAAVAP